MSSSAAIKISNLTVDYENRRILNDISVDIPDGKITVIMGGSGAGKSTLLRSMLGLKKPVSGSINILGTDICHASPSEILELRKKMGVAFQAGALFTSMTVGENVQLALKEHTSLDDNTIKIMTRIKLDMVNMLAHEDLMPSELSGGMTKRAALARAIIMDPRLLFFDEPSAGLDPITSAELDELIIKLNQSMKMTIVVVTHELESIFKIADYIAVLGEGELLLAGTPHEIQASEDPRIAGLLNRTPRELNLDADLHLRRLTGDRSMTEES